MATYAPLPEPKPKMPMTKTVFALSLAVFFDALKFMCELLVFFAPLFVGLFTYVAVGGGTTGKLLGGAATTAAGVASFFGAPAIEAIGVILAMIVGLIGWLFFFTWFLLSGISMFKGGSRFTTAIGGWIASEIPLVNALPTFTISIARIVWSVRAEDKKERLAWEESNKNRQALLVRQQQIQMLQLRQAQEMAAQKAQEQDAELEIQREEVAEVEAEQEEEEKRTVGGAANDELYNPAEDDATNGGEYADYRPNPANDPVYGGGRSAGYNPQAIPDSGRRAA